MVSGLGARVQPLQLAGLVSGLDTANMVKQIMDARKGPLQILQGKAAIQKQEADAVRDVNSRLGNLLTAIKRFADASYTQGKAAAVAPGGANATVAASVSADAVVGSFKVTVNQLADATRTASASAIGAAIDAGALLKDAKFGTAVTAGTFTVNGTSITIDPTVDTLNDVVTRINASAAGVTATIVNDSSGRPNKLQLSGGAAITLGTGADTSNFLTATGLLASPSGTTRTSTFNLGVTQTGAVLNSANLATALSASSGSFKVNGVAISYDATRDSLSTVVARINNSTAGVTATYDSANDKLSIVSRTTGSVGIAFEDTTGNLLDVLGVRTAPQTLGKNAQYQIDTGSGNVTYYSTTNTVANALPGVNLTLLKESATADTVNVSQDLDGMVGRVRDLVGQYNSTVDFIRTQTGYNTVNGKLTGGTLAGDETVRQIADALRKALIEPISGVTSGKTTAGEIGLSFGAVGSAVGTTKALVLDETKFKAALQNDPAGVANVFSAFRATGALDAGGTGSVSAISGDPSGVRRPGSYVIETTAVFGDGTANLKATFKPADGGAETVTMVYGVAPGSTSTTLIAGLTLTFKPGMTVGTDTVTVATPTRGLAAKLEQYLDPLARGDGVLSKRVERENKDVTRLNEQISRMNARLDDERERLTAKFARMEQTIARLNSQRSALASLAALG